MSDLKSLMGVSMHKAGSSVTNGILKTFSLSCGYEIDDISIAAGKSDKSPPEVFVAAQDHMQPNGVYYGMARGPYVKDMPALAGLRLVVQLRDPRDCITSAYFSYAKSHVPPKDPERRKIFEARRQNLQQKTIDDFARDSAANYRMRMQVLSDLLAGHPDALVLKYEEMVTDTDAWLNRIATFLDVPMTDALRAKLAEKGDFSTSGEDTSKHKRQVTPGDHARKLTPETIAELNRVLGPVMERFDYSL